MSARTASGEQEVNGSVNRATERLRPMRGSVCWHHWTSGPTAEPLGTRGPLSDPRRDALPLLLAVRCAGMHPVSRSASTTSVSDEASLQFRDQRRSAQQRARGRVPRNWVHSCTPKRDTDSGPRSRRVRICHLDPTGPHWTSEAVDSARRRSGCAASPRQGHACGCPTPPHAAGSVQRRVPVVLSQSATPPGTRRKSGWGSTPSSPTSSRRDTSAGLRWRSLARRWRRSRAS